ncbi:MAG: inositol monophosphatase, partial [bacterium]|nr:inositol monophosphatase [bacterium]
MDYQNVLDVAQEAALTAGEYLKECFDGQTEIEYKGEIDLVTQRDRESQKKI